jgi:hypothetical protein
MSDTQAANPPAVQKPRKRASLRRWIMRVLVAVVTLLFVVIVATHLVLGTDIPRKMIVVQLQRSLGLRVATQSASVTWMGGTTLRDVSIALPLSDQPMVTVPEMNVSHTILPLLLLGKSLQIKSVTLQRPTLNLVQEPSGQWNVMRAVDIASRTAASAAAPTSSHAVSLPIISISGGSVVVTDNRQRSLTVAPVVLNGKPDGALVWHYKGGVASRLEIDGDVAPGAFWEHSLVFKVQNVRPWLAPWIAEAPIVTASGSWRGRVAGPVVNGRVQLDDLSVGSYSAAGQAMIDRDDSGLRIRPVDLLLNLPERGLRQARIRSGDLHISGAQLRGRALEILAAGGSAQLDGMWDRAAGSADLEAVWQNISLPTRTSHGGNLKATLRTPLPGGQQIRATIFDAGQTEDGAWEASLQLAGIGRLPERLFGQPLSTTQPKSDWPNHFDWEIKAPSISWRGAQSFDLHDIVAKATSRGAAVTFDDLSIKSGGKLAGKGAFDPATHLWWIWIGGDNFAMARPSDATMSFNLLGWGQDQFVKLQECLVRLNTVYIWLGGAYDARLPKPVAVDLHIWKDQSLTEIPQSEHPTLRGEVRAQGHLTGTVWPRNLDVEGDLISHGLLVNDRPIGDSDLVFTGRIEPRHSWLATRDEAELLGGKWRARAEWPSANGQTRLVIGLRDVPVKEVSGLLKGPPAEGRVTGALTFETPEFNVDQLKVYGAFDARDVQAGRFGARRMTAQLSVQDGKVVVNPIDLEQGDGHARGRVDFALDNPLSMRVVLNAKDWPFTFENGAAASVSADSTLRLDLKSQSAAGALHGSARFRINDQDAGQATLQASADGRTVNITRLSATALGGSADGNGVFPLDRPIASAAKLQWKQIDASQLSKFFPRVHGLVGTLSGSATLLPAGDPRAVGPVQIDMKLSPRDAQFRGISLGESSAVAFLEPGTALWDVRRFVLNESTILLADGNLRVWARSSRHRETGARTRTSQAQITFDGLNVDQLFHAIDPSSKPVPGRLAGSIVVAGNPRQRDSLFGQGQLQLTQSDLKNTDVIAGLYDLMRIGEQEAGPTGVGSVDLLLENNTLRLQSFRYFNRGTDIRANVAVENVWNVPTSGLSGYAFGSLRPLKDLKIPFMARADQIFMALQKDAVAVKLSGTLKKPIEEKIAFGEIGEGLQQMILGEVKGETGP